MISVFTENNITQHN